ncbi:MAG TPA: trypsin-like peptidase domain-containing protein [Candidatus Paceibacterota bacterium]|nr:trypsin-like peptidase domain-containing protein [Candidatus Paceibacterota bacterium]
MKITKVIKKISSSLVRIVKIEPQNNDYFEELETGSGFFVDNCGTIATNSHVVEKNNYWIKWQDKKYFAQILATDKISDIAILKIEEKNTPFIKLGDSNKIKLGEEVIALGNVLGLGPTVSKGIISGISKNIYALNEPDEKTIELRGVIQTDAAINPGNSGGPLVNLKGEAIGINAATIAGYENIGFAIPINNFKKDYYQIKKFGKLVEPYLGIKYIVLDEKLKNFYNLDLNYGAYIIKEPFENYGVIPNSPADLAGLKEGDIITYCNNQKITTDKTLKDILKTVQIGKKVKLRVLRENKEFETEIVLQSKND